MITKINRLTELNRRIFDFWELKICRELKLPPKKLLFPVIWVTNRCNLQCKMCDQWKTPPALFKEELIKEEWFGFIDSARRMRSAVIIITGGEPLMREDIFEILAYINQQGLRAHLCSNGTLINKKVAKEIHLSGLSSISISVDSVNSRIHNQLRGLPCFDEAIEGIKNLKKYTPGVKVGINVVINRLNFVGISQMIPFAEKLGVHQIRFDPIHTNLVHRKKNISTFEDLLFTEEDLPELMKEIDRLVQLARKSKISTNSLIFLKGIKKYFLGKVNHLRCYAGYISCAIDAFGNVSPCDNFEGEESITQNSLEEIWSSSSFCNLRNLVHNCNENCWDTTHGELNIRCSLKYCFMNLGQIWREMNFYINNLIK